MRVIWSPLALDRVSEAARYIGQDNPPAAEKWVGKIFELVSRLSTTPSRGRVVPEIGRADVREIFFGVYRIIYRVEATKVLVLTVRHGRRLIAESEVSGGGG